MVLGKGKLLTIAGLAFLGVAGIILIILFTVRPEGLFGSDASSTGETAEMQFACNITAPAPLVSEESYSQAVANSSLVEVECISGWDWVGEVPFCQANFTWAAVVPGAGCINGDCLPAGSPCEFTLDCCSGLCPVDGPNPYVCLADPDVTPEPTNAPTVGFVVCARVLCPYVCEVDLLWFACQMPILMSPLPARPASLCLSSNRVRAAKTISISFLNDALRVPPIHSSR